MTKMDVQHGNRLRNAGASRRTFAPSSIGILRSVLLGAALSGLLALPGSAQESSTPPVPPTTETTPALPQSEVAPPPSAPSELQGTLPPGHPAIPAEAAPNAASNLPLEAAPGPGDVPSLLPHDLSPIGMFRAAHWVVKAVMISLAFACFVTWTVFLFKSMELLLAQRRLRATRLLIDAAANLPDAAKSLNGRTDPAAFMVLAVREELLRSDAAIDPAGTAGVKERTRSLLDRIEAQAGRHLRRGTGMLATIGSTAPFVGLFGTVWGIMNAFIGIAESKTTNLAVVAPGIAEALLATAIGLVAAIPAVMIYNVFARATANYRLSLGDAGAGIERLVSRDLDFRTLRKGA